MHTAFNVSACASQVSTNPGASAMPMGVVEQGSLQSVLSFAERVLTSACDPSLLGHGPPHARILFAIVMTLVGHRTCWSAVLACALPRDITSRGLHATQVPLLLQRPRRHQSLQRPHKHQHRSLQHPHLLLSARARWPGAQAVAVSAPWQQAWASQTPSIVLVFSTAQI